MEAPEDGLQAKFSIAYLTGYALLRGPPRVESFDAVDPEVAELAAGIEVVADPALAESEAVLSREGAELARIAAAPGSAQRPLEPSQLEQKWRRLGGDSLPGLLDDPLLPAAEVLRLSGLEQPALKE